MKAIILAAGEGTRMRPLTYTVHKPMLRVLDKPILQHNIEQIVKSGVDEIIIIIGHKAEQVTKHFGNEFNGCKINYITQEIQVGTGHALQQAKNFVTGENFLVMYGDDVYNSDDIEKVLKNDLCVSGTEVEEPERFGIIIGKDNIEKIVEKPDEPISNIANSGLYMFNKDIFEFLEGVSKSVRNELELTDAVNEMAKKHSIKLEKIKNWIPVGYPWDLLNADEKLLDKLENTIDATATIDGNVTIVGNVKIGKNTIIKSGSYIEGPLIIGNDCVIGPNSYIRPNSIVGNNCRIGNAVEIKNSIIGNNTKIEHLSYIGDSVIGNNCNLACGTITANLRHDNQTAKVLIKDKLVDTRRRKFGCVLADYTKTGIHTSLYPGVMMGPFSWSAPNVVIERNVKPFHIFDGEEKLLDKNKIEMVVKDKEDLESLKQLYDKLNSKL